MTVRRAERIRMITAKRQQDVVVVLENVHDPHNIGAVLRTCDSVGVTEVIALYTEAHLTQDTLDHAIRSKTSSGAYRWVEAKLIRDVDECVAYLRAKGLRILGTHLHAEAKSIYDSQFTDGVAVVLGNEKIGLSSKMQAHLDGNIFIPQVGMVKSLNISVACAIVLYEIYRQREQIGLYNKDSVDPDLYQKYVENHKM